jgi:acetylornithine deacetylase/succinyl-diaminopimelate desuccinylase-like protein
LSDRPAPHRPGGRRFGPQRWALAALLLLASAGAAVRSGDIASRTAREARAWRERHEREILVEFTELLAIPNVARDRANIDRNVERLVAMLERRGLAVQVLRLPGAAPLIVAERRARGAARTLAFYAHYDGQPADTASWNGLPWTPVLRDASGREHPLAGSGPVDPSWLVYARSAGDDKGPIQAMLVALDAMRAAKRVPAFHLRLVLEGEEEAGSPNLATYMEKHPELLRPDAWIICDGPVHQSGRPLMAFGARGVVGLELTVYGPVKSPHDGHYGNWVPNPAARLAHLLAGLRDEQGRITIPGFHDHVVPPSEAEKRAVAEIPDLEPVLRGEFQLGGVEGGGERLDATLLRPALNIRGLQAAAVGTRATNSIPTEARASIDFRLVPAQTPASVRAAFEGHLRSLGWTIVEQEPDSAARVAHPHLVRLAWSGGYPAARTPLDAPLALEMAGLLGAIGRDPVRTPTLGGSVPFHLFQQPRGTPVIILPIANHDDNQHAPNENLRLQNLWDGIEVFAALFSALGR